MTAKLQLLGGPKDGLLVDDDGQPAVYVSLPPGPAGSYYRMHDMRSYTPRTVMVWEGTAWAGLRYKDENVRNIR